MVSEAYALALQVKDDEMLYKDGLSIMDVDLFMTKHSDRIFLGYEDFPRLIKIFIISMIIFMLNR